MTEPGVPDDTVSPEASTSTESTGGHGLVVLVAMEAEARGVRTRYGLEGDGALLHPAFPARTWSTDTAEGRVSVVTNGVDPDHGVDLIGTTAATATTLLAIERHRPAIVVSAGTCGGFAARGGRIGSTYLASEVRRHDRRVDVDGLREMLRADEGVLDAAHIAAELGLEVGPVTTSDALDAPPLDLDRMHAVGAVSKDMEAAAVAWVCARMGVGFQACKVVTDLVDDPEETPSQFLRNLAAAGDRLAEIVPPVVAALLARTRSA